MVLKTRDKLIEVARQLFAQKGEENTTMNDIAVASEKGRRTVYTYFKNKKEILNLPAMTCTYFLCYNGSKARRCGQMQTKIRLPWKAIILILAAVLVLAALLAKPGYYLYRELEYKYGNPTEEEQMVHAYAQLKDIPYGKYPKDLIALLKTSPEARDLVLDYPVREDMEVDLSAYADWNVTWCLSANGEGFMYYPDTQSQYIPAYGIVILTPAV